MATRKLIQTEEKKVSYDENHTKAYNQYKNILTWKEYDFNDAKKKAVLPIDYESQNSLDNIYFMTKYMRDDELNLINYERQRGCGCGTCQLKQIPRLAYIGDGKYKVIENQAEKMKIEKETFKDYKLPDLNILFSDIQENWEY